MGEGAPLRQDSPAQEEAVVSLMGPVLEICKLLRVNAANVRSLTLSAVPHPGRVTVAEYRRDKQGQKVIEHGEPVLDIFERTVIL